MSEHEYEMINCSIGFGQNRDDDVKLVRKDDGEIQRIRLYNVSIITPVNMFDIAVLAESEKGAIKQALCWLGCSVYNTSKEILDLVHCHAEPEPLVIRGWGSREF